MRIIPALAAFAIAGALVTPPPRAALRPAQIVRANASALHAARLKAWRGVRYCGAVSGDSTGNVCTVVEMDDGAYRSSFTSGPFVQDQGFDGAAWVAKNGLVSVVDLPGLHRDAVTSAYLQSDGWLRTGDTAHKTYAGERVERGRTYDIMAAVPKGGSQAVLWFDARTHLLARAVVASEYGPDRFDYSDYETVEGVKWALEIVETDPTGARTITRVSSVQWLHAVPRTAIARDRNNAAPALRGVVRVPIRSDAPTYMAHIVLPLEVNKHTVQVLFDTGGQNSLDIPAARGLGFKSAGAIAVGGSGSSSATAQIARATSMAIGRATLKDPRFIVFGLPYQIAHPAYRVHVDGIVGAEILQNFRVTINYGARLFEVASFSAPRTARGVTIPFWSDGSHAYVQAIIDGARGLFGLDTGDPGGVTVFGSFARRHGLYQSKGLRYFGFGIGGADAEDLYRGKSFLLGGVRLSAPIVKVSRSTSGDFSARSVAGNLGADVLSRFTITFDYRARTVTFEPNSQAHRPFREDMTGLTVVQQKAGALHVVAVAPGTPAAKAGLRPGDEITSVNARSVDLMGVKDFDALRFGGARFTITIERNATRRTLAIYPRPLL